MSWAWILEKWNHYTRFEMGGGFRVKQVGIRGALKMGLEF